MSDKTVYVQEIIKVGDPFSVDPPFTAVTGHPSFSQPSPISFFNSKGSGYNAHIKLMNLRPLSGPNAAASIISVQRITAYTGGTVKQPFSFDSNNAALPSQVTAVTSPASVTLVATDEYRRSMILCEQNPTRTLATLCACANGDARTGFDSGEFIRLTGDSDVTGYILREGQGIALVNKANSAAHCYVVNIRMKVQSTGACYRYEHVIEPVYMSGDAPFLLFNGSGSGLVLEVEKIQIREIGTDEYVTADYSLIDGIMGAECPCEDAGYIMADSTDSLPSGILIKKNCVTARLGSKIGALITLPANRRLTLTESPYGPGITRGPQIARRGIFTPDMAGPDIVLREGMGIGLFLRNGGSQLFYEFSAIITLEEIPVASGGGATCFAF